MSSAWEGAVGATKLADYSYDSLSRRTQLQFAGQSNNRMTYTYEPDSNLDLLNSILSGATISLEYGHNASGQIRSISANDNFYLPSPPASSSVAYVADKLNRYGDRRRSGCDIRRCRQPADMVPACDQQAHVHV